MTHLKSNIKLNVSAFTRIGVNKIRNDDRILVNREIYKEGFIQLENLDALTAFVADGIGGNRAGAFAAEFVLKEILIKEISSVDFNDKKNITSILHSTNINLLEKTSKDINLLHAGTTLAGLIINLDSYLCFSVGDSQVWFCRNNDLYLLSNNQVLDDTPNSPLLSYFGGEEDKMQLAFYDTISELIKGDIFLICTDGLLKALEFQKIRSIINNSCLISEKISMIYNLLEKVGNVDDVSCILLQIINNKRV